MFHGNDQKIYLTEADFPNPSGEISFVHPDRTYDGRKDEHMERKYVSPNVDMWIGGLGLFKGHKFSLSQVRRDKEDEQDVEEGKDEEEGYCVLFEKANGVDINTLVEEGKGGELISLSLAKKLVKQYIEKGYRAVQPKLIWED
jgi:hypothetical protein